MSVISSANPDAADEFRGSKSIGSIPNPAVDELSLREIASAVARGRKVIIKSTVVAVVLSTVVAFLITPKFTSEAVILTPQQSQSSMSAMAQLAGLSSVGAISPLTLLSGLGLHTQTDLYIGILESRTIADALISRFDLRRVYDVPDFYKARKKLRKNSRISAGRDTLIHIRVEDKDPRLAARIAQGYVDELSRQSSTVALTEASQRRVFFETQMRAEKDELSNAEIALRKAQESTGLVAPTGQAEALVRSLAQLKAEILTREAKVQGMRAYVADDNPRLQAVLRELGTLRSEFEKLEQGRHTPGSPELAAAELPEAGLEYLRRYRDLKYHEALFEVLSKQYEAARLDEAKTGPLVQVIDKAIPSERKSWPPRAIIIISCTVLSAVLSALWSVAKATSGPRSLQ